MIQPIKISYPVKCPICHKTIAENEEQFDNQSKEPIYSENMGGYPCEECKDILYYCFQCEDYSDELVTSHGDQVCVNCERANDREDTDRKVSRDFIRGML